MDRNKLPDADADRLVFVPTEPVEAEIYDYPGDYAQRFDGIEPRAGDGADDLAFEFTSDGAGEYQNTFECIPAG